MIKRLMAAAAALAIATPAMASPVRGDAEWNLIRTIEQTGTTVYLECPEDAGFAGVYMSQDRIMGICVDGRSPRHWTADERDTLRHEAVHLAQDCWGRLADGRLETTQTITALMRLVQSTGIPAERIEEVYRRNGADDMTIVLELEAFSLAAALTTDQVDDLVRKACFR